MDNKHFYKIGEIAEELKVNQSLIRYWEKEFSDYLNPRRNNRGVRLYTKEEVDFIKQIYQLVKVQRMTIKGAYQYLKKQRKAFKNKHELIEALKNVKNFLIELKKYL